MSDDKSEIAAHFHLIYKCLSRIMQINRLLDGYSARLWTDTHPGSLSVSQSVVYCFTVAFHM